MWSFARKSLSTVENPAILEYHSLGDSQGPLALERGLGQRPSYIKELFDISHNEFKSLLFPQKRFRMDP